MFVGGTSEYDSNISKNGILNILDVRMLEGIRINKETGVVQLEKSFKQYVVNTLAIFGLISSMIVLFNWFIDPYGVWQRVRIHGINEIMNLSGHERLYKMIRLSYDEKLDVLFLGSSTVYNALYPKTYFSYTGKKAYNGGLNGANVLELKKELEQAIYFHPEMDEVIIGLNWFMFSTEYQGLPKAFPDNQIGWRFPVGRKCVDVLFSMDALNDSISTIRSSLTGNEHNLIDEDGKFNEYYISAFHAGSKDIEQFAADTIAQIPLFKTYCLSEESIQTFAEIIDICRAHDIELKVYINPVHSIFLESIYQSGGGEKFEEWKRLLASMYPINDFAHYSVISNEPFSSSRRYWRNTQHPMPVTGDIVLQKLGGGDEKGKFGILLTDNNVEEILETERKVREIWREENSETVQFVEGLVNRY